MSAVNVVLIGLGGYGAQHLTIMRPAIAESAMRLAGIVDPFASRAPDWPDIQSRDIPVWGDLAAMRAAGGKGDLAVIASPIQFHCPQTCEALEMGMNVLCEKPAAACLDEVGRMIAAREKADRLVAIGYQWSFASATRRLKNDIQAGRYGRPKRLRTWVAWPRSAAYYGRNNWAGRIRDDAGRLVNDSPVNNATAHYLHNMLYLLGRGGPDSAAAPASVEGELFRANRIDNFDTACLRIITDAGTEVLFYTSHCGEHHNMPTSVFEFEHGTVTYGGAQGDTLTGTRDDGATVAYGSPNEDGMQRKLRDTLTAVARGERGTVCGLEAASMHTRVIDELQKLPIHTFDAVRCHTRTDDQNIVTTFVPGLYEALEEAFSKGRLLGEGKNFRTLELRHPPP